MAEHNLVEQIVKFAFLMRLASLLMVFLIPGNVIRSWVGLSAIVFITATSAVGIYRTKALTRIVSAHPLLVVIDVLVAGGIAALVGSQSPLIIYTLSTAVLTGILLTPPVAALVGSVLISSYLLVVISEDLSSDVTSQLVIPITYAMVGALGSLARSLHESAMAEQVRAQRLAEVAAHEHERARLARQMHDSVAKTLHGIGLAAAALPAWVEKDPDELAAKARQLQHAAENASREARDILVELRSDQTDRTLVEQLRELVEELRSVHGISATLSIEAVGDCDHAIKSELVSIAGEALENVQRHSRASSVRLSCVGSAEAIHLDIVDDGVGFETESKRDGHFGLVGMRERADSIEADLTIDSHRGTGTTVSVRAPRTLLIRGTP